MLTNRVDFFRDITSALLEGVIIIDEAGIIQAANKAVSDLFGYSADELRGQNVKMLMPPEYSTGHDRYIQNHIETGVSKILEVGREVTGLKKDGGTFPLNLKVHRSLFESETYFIGVIYSLDERVRTNQTIKFQTELLQRAEKVGHIGHWHLNLATSELFWSDEVYRIHGRDPDSFVPDLENALDCYHPDDVHFVQDTLDLAISKRTDFTFEARIIRPDGEIVHVRSSGETSTNTGGDVIAVFGIFQDISEEKQFQAQLEDQNEFLTLTMDTVPDVMFVKDKQFRIVRANPAFLNLYPPDTREAVIGTTTLEEYDEEEAAAFLEQDRIAFETGRSDTLETIMFPDGRQRTLQTTKVRFMSEGQPYILGLARDITDIIDAQKELKRTNRQLEEFTYRTSHDLRAPLISSIGLLDVAQGALQDGDTETVRQCIDMSHESLKELEQLVQDLLQLSKSQNKEEEVQAIDVGAVVTRALAKVSHLEHFSRLEIQTDISFDGWFNTQPDQFSLIIENLISNAVKYQDLDEPSPHVCVTIKRRSENILVSVLDNGIGIPKEQETKLFQMFTRLHHQMSFGSGLGLYMVKQSVERLGGSVRYIPRTKGSEFEVQLPVLNPEL